VLLPCFRKKYLYPSQREGEGGKNPPEKCKGVFTSTELGEKSLKKKRVLLLPCSKNHQKEFRSSS